MLGKFPVLSETFILNQITGMIDRGHEVEIFGNIGDKKNIHHPEIQNYNLLDKTYFFPDIPANFLFRLAKALILIITLFPQNPRAVIMSLNVMKYGWIASSLRLVFILKPFIQAERDYDIVHCHFRVNGIRAAFLRDVGLLKGKLVTVFHGADVAATINGHGRKSFQYLLQKGDLFLPISDRWRRELIKLGASPDCTIVHRMGVERLNSPTIYSKNERTSQIRIVSVCRLTEKKGIKYSLAALASRELKDMSIQYDVLGDGPLMDELVTLSEELGINNFVKFHGAMNKLKVQEFLSKADIFVLPSVTARDGDQEGIPVSIMEAMLFGIPVVSTIHSGIPELIENDETGILVAEKDIFGLTNAIVKLVQDPKLRCSMGEMARQFIIKNYDISTLNDQLELYFNNVMQTKRAIQM